MRCNKVRKLLGAYLDGELPEKRVDRIQDHLSECSLCAWELKSFRKVDELGRWIAKTESAQLPDGYWENYQTRLHEILEHEDTRQSSGMGEFLNRFWHFSTTFAAYWSEKLAPGLAAAVVIIAFIMGINYISHQPNRSTIQKSSAVERSNVNLYLREHESAIMLTSNSPQSAQRGIELGYEDVFYYDAAKGTDREWPGETGVFLRAPRRSSYPVGKEPAKDADVANSQQLSLKEAQETVNFGIVAPQILHPAYFLESIRKINGREAIQLIYTNGINTLSLFEQALGNSEKLRSSDLRKYVLYSSDRGESANIIGWNSAEISFTLIGEKELSHLMEIIRRIQADYLGEDTVEQPYIK